MAVSQQIAIKNMIHIHLETTNKSFLDVHYFLKAKGIKNNAFFLSLYDTDLIGVNPFDPNLSTLYKQKILRECMLNYWYWLRECVILNTEGANMSQGTRYKLHRGNLAMNFLSILNFNMFVELPRQHGKTTAAVLRYLWVFNLGTTNSEIMFIHKNHDGSKENLQRLKNYREALPSFLRMDAMIGANGKQVRVPNTVETLENPANHNRIKTLPSARNKMLANTLGRGCTQPLQYYDEFGWILHNQLIYESATPAFSRASQNAKAAGAPYGIILTTTPGDLTTKEGEFAYMMKNAATPFQEEYYDYTLDQLNALKESNTNSSFFYVRYSYLQLGSTEEYFKEQVRLLNKNYAAVRREVLLEWSDVSEDCPFSKEDLDIIAQFCKVPLKVVMFGPYGQYQMLIYQEMDPRHGQIVGVDVAGGMRRDSSAITVVDANTTEVVATLNCNYMPLQDLASTIYDLITRYLPNALVAIERNGIGHGVIATLMNTQIKRNLYYEIEERSLTERTNGVIVDRGKHMVKAYGINNSGAIRARMIEILFSRVQYHKDKFIARILHDEMAGLTYRTSRNGGNVRIDHSVNTHDDQIFSYLMAMYVWYDCKDLASRFGIVRGEIKTDDDIEEKLGTIEDLYSDNYEDIEINNDDEYEQTPILADVETRQILADAAKPLITARDKEHIEYDKDMACLQELMKNPVGREAIEKSYNIDLSHSNLYGMDNSYIYGPGGLPQEVYDSWYADDDEYEEMKNKELHGNLYGQFLDINDF